MATTKRVGRNPEDLARLGGEILRSRIEPVLGLQDAGKFVAIDVDDGDFEIDADDHAAVARLLVRHPSSEIWLGRVGQPTTYRIGRNQ